MKSISTIEGAHATSVGLLSGAIKTDPNLGQLAPYPQQAKQSSALPAPLVAVAARPPGQGWPYWLPPSDVQQRISRPGTPLLEVIVTLASAESGSGKPDRTDTLGTLAAFDQTTKKWWIVQFWIYNPRAGGAVNGSLF